MKPLTLDTIQAIAKLTAELNRDVDPRTSFKRLPNHHCVWILERIAGVGDGYVPEPIQSIIDAQPDS